MIVRYTEEASKVRRQGHFASIAVIRIIGDRDAQARRLQEEAPSLTLGDLALLAEYAAEQWQRDRAASLLKTQLLLESQ